MSGQKEKQSLTWGQWDLGNRNPKRNGDATACPKPLGRQNKGDKRQRKKDHSVLGRTGGRKTKRRDDSERNKLVRRRGKIHESKGGED